MSHLSEEQLDQIIAAERWREQEPLNDWRTIAARARAEGLIRDIDAVGGRSSSQAWLQAAAAILILIGGIAIGHTSIGLPSGSESAAAGAQTASTATATPAPVTTSSPVSASSDASFASVDDAAETLDRALRDYQRASRYIAANNVLTKTGDSVAIYTARAAALDKIVNATESALRTAPHDPVINQYYLATMGAQVATRQMVAVGMRGF
ncbi:MAG TPA: hypothetical protein VIG78_02450 [Gemmatimonadaceae bacterium]|jgi:hypothetical protein